MNDADREALERDNIMLVQELGNGEALGLTKMAFTTALVVLADGYAKNAEEGWCGWRRRFCYEQLGAAFTAAALWDGADGTDPPGPWVKEKSPGGDRLNPRLADPLFDEV